MTEPRAVAVAIGAIVVFLAAPGRVTGQSFVIDQRPALVLEPSAAEPLGPVAGATRLTTGRIALVEAGEASVRFFDSTGRETGRVGRRGRGPGEFQRIAWMGQCGRDSLFMWDASLRRVTIIDGDGTLLSQARLEGPSHEVPAFLACSPRGFLAFIGRPDPPDEKLSRTQFVRTTGPLVIGRIVPRQFATVGTVEAGEIAYTRELWLPRPVGRPTQLAVAGDRIYLGTGDSAVVGRMTLVGKPDGLVRLNSAARAVGKRHVERSIEDLLGYMTGTIREGFRKSLSAIPPPARLPFYSALRSDAAGNLYVIVSYPGDAQTTIQQYSASGVLQGSASIPFDAVVLEISASHLIATYLDADGEPVVGMFAVGNSR